MNGVHCAGCRRRIGFGTKHFPGRIWCSVVCMYLPSPTSSNEARDDVIFLLHKLGTSTGQLAAQFSLTRQRIDQIVLVRSTPT